MVDAEPAAGLAGSVLGGFVRTVTLEMPSLGARLFDLDPGEPDSLGRLVGELLHPDRETAVAWRGGTRRAARLVRADVADGAAVEAMLERTVATLPPLTGVIHAAGTLSDGALSNLSHERFRRVTAAKVHGAWNLHRSTMGMKLERFLLFSSLAGVTGNAGQANHAAANAFLDQLARHRRALDLPGQAIAWGAWLGIGKAEEERERIGERIAAGGVGWMPPQQGLACLDRLLREEPAAAVAAPVDWQRFARGRESEPMLEEVVVVRPGTNLAPAASPDILSRLRDTPADRREGMLIAFVQRELQVIRHLPEPPPADTGFFDLGMDSLMAVELRGRLNRALAGVVTLPGSVAFDYPNATRLARHLADRIGVLPEVPGLPAARPTARLEADPEDGIDVVGMACRFPGAEDLDAFRDLLMAGRSGVREVPAERRPVAAEAETAVHPACRWGAFVDGIDRFDASFFRIAPIEAKLLDPQQRMLLETSWLALEDAGIDPSGIRGSRTGVYAGICGFDYHELISETAEAPHLYSITGGAHSTASGRIAFALGLEGPAMTIDTACSSSLVALHLAATALRRGEADLALAGGANTLLSAAVTEAFAEGGMLAPDGRCKTFDAAADGFVRGEGCGVVVLKRLAEARADGNRVWAVIRGTAVNQDGASAGLTAPNGPSQERVISAALEQAGISPADVDYLEAHGTGTELGDPIEIGAASAVYGPGRSADRPLVVGSVKTNIGHLEAAAGVAGLIKTVLAMASGTIPRHLNFSHPNPHVDWAGLPVRVAAEAQAWPDTGRRAPLAAISSFGLSGTNSHVIVEGGKAGEERGEAGAGEVVGSALAVPLPDRTPPAGAERRERLLPLSGRTAAALGAQANRYAAWLQAADAEGLDERLADMAWTAAIGRQHFDFRAGVVFADAAELAAGLVALAAGRRQGRTGMRTRIGFLFTGQGSQWRGMGRALYDCEPVVRDVLDRCEAAVREMRGESLLEAMFESTALDDTRWTQPALYALECALAAQWAALGVTPAALLGHSVGELSAAHVAGAFSLEEGLRFATRRGDLMASLPGTGAMAAVFAPREEVAEAAGDDVSIAADNGTHLVVSGPAAAVSDLCGKLAAARRRTEPLRTSHAFHSALMEPALDELERIAGEMSVTAPTVPLVGNVSGRELAAAPDSGYWRRRAREEVAFAAGVSRMAALGIDCLIEIGPHPVLGPLALASWPGTGDPPPVVASLERPSAKEAARGFAVAAAAAWEAGIAMDLAGLFSGERRRRISVPTYPFEHRRHWVEGPRRRHRPSAARHPHRAGKWRSGLRAGPVRPGAGVAGGAPGVRSAGRTGCLVGIPCGGGGAGGSDHRPPVEEFQIHAPLLLPDGGECRRLQIVLGSAGTAAERSIGIHSRGPEDSDWTLHAEGRLAPGAAVDDEGPVLPGALEPVDVAGHYAALAALGVEHGPVFRRIDRLRRGRGEAVADLSPPAERQDAETGIHPALLDNIFQTIAATARMSDVPYLLFGWELMQVRTPLPERLTCHVRLRGGGGGDGKRLPRGRSGDHRRRHPPRR